MLVGLHIKNVALIDEVDIQFDERLNILSGETGAGKSVILDSINFVLGSKADKGLIRYGTNEAMVRAEFSVADNPAVRETLVDFDIDSSDEIVISRKLNVEGKGSIKVNGVGITLGMLKKLASQLVDVHGQSEHFFLLSENNQLSVIDGLCGAELESAKQNLKSLLLQKKEYLDKIQLLGGSEQERSNKLDLLSYQIAEIERAEIKEGEIEELKARKKVLDNAEKVVESLGAVKEILQGDNCCSDMISAAKRRAGAISDVGNEYAAIYDRLENLSVEADDIASTVSDMLDEFSFDESEADRVEQRLELYKNLVKKYGEDEGAILQYLQDAHIKYDTLVDAAAETDKLNGLLTATDKEIFEACKRITEIRTQASKSFCKSVVEQLKPLNIPNAVFNVEFSPYDENSVCVTGNGADKICFMFSANKGELVKPLSKIISGGEMSRFMLAIKTCLRGINGITTYIFDEIDSGISGVTAKSVAEKFVAISRDTQIIAVSHLPQVCAAATAQYYIYKSEINGKTISQIKPLNRDERVDEIVRLTGGLVSDAAKAHADELLKQYGN